MTRRKLPLVTVGIPTFNRAKSLLPIALRGALNQTYPNFEVVISDNGSTDGTEELIRGHSVPGLRYFKQTVPLTPADNFNFCLEQARGRYFVLLHDDDQIDCDFVETCLETVDYSTEVGVIRTGTRLVDMDGNVVAQAFNRSDSDATVGDFFLGWLRGRTSFYCCSTLFNTDFLRASGGLVSRHNVLQDVAAIARLVARHGRADFREPKASFRRHHSNMGNTTAILKWCEDSLYVLDLMCELAPERAPEIRREGLVFMTRGNYHRLSRNPDRKLRSFWTIYKIFGRVYSPYRYLSKRALGKGAATLSRAARRLPGVASLLDKRRERKLRCIS